MRISNVLLLGGASLIVAAPAGAVNEGTRGASISFPSLRITRNLPTLLQSLQLSLRSKFWNRSITK